MKKNQHHTSTPSGAPTELVPDWKKLDRSDEVDLYLHRASVASGRVDMLAPDGGVLWIIQNDGKGRAMFLHSDGLTVFRRPGTGNTSRRNAFYKT